MNTVVKLVGIIAGVVSVAALNWWALFTSLVSPSHNTIGRLFAVATFSGALAGAKIGWDVCDLKREAKNGNKSKGAK